MLQVMYNSKTNQKNWNVTKANEYELSALDPFKVANE